MSNGLFGSLSTPEGCDFVAWAGELKQLLYQADAYLRNVVVVPCGTVTADFGEFVEAHADLSSVMVIESCSPPAIWYHNGTLWKEMLTGAGLGNTTYPVLAAYQNEVVYPYSLGQSGNVGWQNVLFSNESMISLSGSTITIHASGFYRFNAACSLRLVFSPGNVGFGFFSHNLYHGSTYDSRNHFGMNQARPYHMALYPANNFVSADFILPRDLFPAGVSLNSDYWWVNLRQSGVRYLEAGDTVYFRMQSSHQAGPSIWWGIGGIASNYEQYEYLLVERIGTL